MFTLKVAVDFPVTAKIRKLIVVVFSFANLYFITDWFKMFWTVHAKKKMFWPVTCTGTSLSAYLSSCQNLLTY